MVTRSLMGFVLLCVTAPALARSSAKVRMAHIHSVESLDEKLAVEEGTKPNDLKTKLVAGRKCHVYVKARRHSSCLGK